MFWTFFLLNIDTCFVFGVQVWILQPLRLLLIDSLKSHREGGLGISSFSKWPGLTSEWRKLKWYDFGRWARRTQVEKGLRVLLSSLNPKIMTIPCSLVSTRSIISTSEMSLAFRRRTIDLVCALPHQWAVTGLHPNWGN